MIDARTESLPIGVVVAYRLGKLTIQATIVNTRVEFGRPEYQLEPVAGEGSAGVWKSECELWSARKEAS